VITRERHTDQALGGHAPPDQHPTAAHLRRLARCADLVRVGLARLVRAHPAFDLLFTLALVAEVIGTAAGVYDSLGAAVITTIAVMCLAALSEIVESVGDGTVATNYSQGYDDTIVDLWVDAIAAVGAGALVAGWLRGQAEADR
jgi:hypothetical protein